MELVKSLDSELERNSIKLRLYHLFSVRPPAKSPKLRQPVFLPVNENKVRTY